jgi:hypothetical protein
MIKYEINATTGEETITPLEGAELAEYLANEAAAVHKATAEQQAATAKANAKQAILDKLGLTADEAAALLS